ncbi:unnamed protein product [Meloidogyne enterolobii]|uniref:Uncharacterized protein n=1 Tax=Meloidogyne enterolobii TaxID=390850 RepID=A0ACB0YWP7_MELEN
MNVFLLCLNIFTVVKLIKVFFTIFLIQLLIVSLEKFPEELFAIAEKYQVLPLKEICEQFMASGIDAKNFGKRYLYAGVHGLPMVEKACVDFISANRKKFLASNEWKEFEAEYKEMADHLLISVAYDGNNA